MHMLARLKNYSSGTAGSSIVALLTSLLSLLTVTGTELQRCTVTEDCPAGGFCFKDECSRCLCPEGFHAIQLFTDAKLTMVCQKRPEESVSRVYEKCSRQQGSRSCPEGSRCDQITSSCLCNRGYRPHADNSRCRFGMYDESCSRRQKCDSVLGLQCKNRRCRCKASYHRPSRWTQFVLGRWDYSGVEGEPQECVARAVGEPCQSDAECGAVQGSGAVCGLCGFCECRVPGHVPDVLGTTCGPGMGMGQACVINSDFVCDGTRGFQCGDICDLYAFDYSKKFCRCSQMHDRTAGGCVAKQTGSPCYTDLDCYPVREGFGYCEGGRCHADIAAAPPDYQPYLASRDCRIKRPMSTMPPGGGMGHKKHKSDRQKMLNVSSHQEHSAPHAGKYHDDDSDSLVVDFDNITDIFSVELTTPHQQSADKVNSVRQISSATTSSGQAPPPRRAPPGEWFFLLSLWVVALLTNWK